MWFLYEEGVFGWLTASSYSRLGEWLQIDLRVALTIDPCDLKTGKVLAVTAVGNATISPLDPELGARKLTKPRS